MRVARHVAITTALVVATCLVVGGCCGYSLDQSVARLPHLTGPAAVDTVVSAERAQVGLLLTGLILLVVLPAVAAQAIALRRTARRPGKPVRIRPVRIGRGLGSRWWLETETTPRTWYPVNFHPALLELPAPVELCRHGTRLAAFTHPGRSDTLTPPGQSDTVTRPERTAASTLSGRTDTFTHPGRSAALTRPGQGGPIYPSGLARRTPPRGRRTDSPAQPDDHAADRARDAARLRRQFRVDAVRVVPAPFVGLIWVYLDGGGATEWLAATALTAALGLWWAALRGSDPS